jgi:hypothetical protein
VRWLGLMLACRLLLGAADAQAQQADEPAAEEADAWAFSASLITFFLPDEDDFATVALDADLESWHFGARYNYEAVRAASLWTGPSFSVGEVVVFDLTLMFGGVFGEMRGFAPGFLASLGWWKLELYSEGEYVFDVRSRDDWYYYSWSELTIAPLEWLSLGAVAERTRAYRTEFDLQRGLLLGLQYEEFYFTGYVLNPAHEAIVALELGAEW